MYFIVISSKYGFIRIYKTEYWGCNLKIFLNNLKYFKNLTSEIFVIGGASIYEQLLPYCEVAYITKCFQIFEADKFMINLETENNWELLDSSEIKNYKNLTYKFLTFKNTRIKI